MWGPIIYRLSEVRRRGSDIEGPIIFESDKKNLGPMIIDDRIFYRKDAPLFKPKN